MEESRGNDNCSHPSTGGLVRRAAALASGPIKHSDFESKPSVYRRNLGFRPFADRWITIFDHR